MAGRSAVTAKDYEPEWRTDQIGRLYDKIGSIRENRIHIIRELEGTGQDARLQRILDETQAVVDAVADRIEFLVEHGQSWLEDGIGNSAAAQLRADLWECLEAEARAVEMWEREHEHRPLPEIVEELTRLHNTFRSGLERLERTSGE